MRQLVAVMAQRLTFPSAVILPRDHRRMSGDLWVSCQYHTSVQATPPRRPEAYWQET